MQHHSAAIPDTQFNTRKLTTMAMLAAVGVVLASLIHFPLFPSAALLEYDPADIAVFIGTFLFGPLSGLILAVVVSVVQGLTVSAGSGFIGILMHILATGTASVIIGLIYHKRHTKTGAVLALLAGVVAMTIMMVLCNLVFTPIFMGAPLNVVIGMLAPVIIPFNLAKAGINAVVTYLVYKPISRKIK